jgi:hypothetical protein
VEMKLRPTRFPKKFSQSLRRPQVIEECSRV